MEENIFEKLMWRWRELEAKLPVAQTIRPGQSFQPSYISPAEREELKNLTKEILEKYLDKLSPSDRFELERRQFIGGN